MIGFIDEYRGLYGVEPICDHLQIAPSTYYGTNDVSVNRHAGRLELAAMRC